MDDTGRGRALVALATLALCLIAAALAQAEPERDRLRPDIDIGTSGHDSELVESIKIRRKAAASRKVVASTPLPKVDGDDRIELAAEVTATNTCVVPGPRCIGRRYLYSPIIGAQLRLAERRSTAGRRNSIALSKRKTLSCAQRRPDRNHHCPMVIFRPARALRDYGTLPCDPARCRVNLVLDAHHPNARPGNRLILGADRPDGSVSQDRARLDAVVFRSGFATSEERSESKRPRRRHLKMVRGALGSRSGGHTVLFSTRVPDVERGAVISARADQKLSISHLSYSAFVSTELILATRPGRTSPDAVVKRSATFNGHLSETTGFNCTQGPSAFRSPCESRKAGVVQLRRTPTKSGKRVPLYVNLVTRSFPKLTPARKGDRAKVLSGAVDVVAYPKLQQPEDG